MRIVLERLWTPECAEDIDCALCGEAFTLGVVIARAVTDEKVDAGEVCPKCALHLADGPMGRARPEHFPDLDAFAWQLNYWQGSPVYRSDEEMEQKFDKDFG
jgi:hypothetical protein